jgi:hypothetical protein
MESASSSSATYCEKHPDRETVLQCNRCGRYMCAKCAVHTPTGYRCVDCVKQQSKVFDTAEVQDYVLASIVAVVLASIGSAIASRIGFFTILLAPAAGTVIAEAVRAVVRKRRSKLLYRVVAIAVVVGSLPLLVTALLLMFANPGFIWKVLWQAVYTSMATSAAYYRLSGISIKR